MIVTTMNDIPGYEVDERAPARFGDLLRIIRGKLVVFRLGKNDVGAPLELAPCVREDRVRRDEIAPQLDVEPGLFERLADRTCDEVLARLDPAARRAPDA